MEDQALNHLSILLSQVVHQSSKPGSLRERLQFMSDDFARRYLGKLDSIVSFSKGLYSKQKSEDFHNGNDFL